MSKGRTPIPPAPPQDDAPLEPDFEPVRTRARHDGWTPDKQVAFVEALSASGCVDHAARDVGMHVASAYRLRARADAQSFRAAWDFALEYAVTRLADAALSRAIHGVARPVFYQGEQIGERRYYDERLAMFVLRTRDPARFGAWIDHLTAAERHPETTALGLNRAIHTLADHAWAEVHGAPKPEGPIAFPQNQIVTDRDAQDAEAERAAEIAKLRDDLASMQSSRTAALVQAAKAEAALAAAQRSAQRPAEAKSDRDVSSPSSPFAKEAPRARIW